MEDDVKPTSGEAGVSEHTAKPYLLGAAVAQSVERRIGSAEVTGSIPVSSFPGNSGKHEDFSVKSRVYGYFLSYFISESNVILLLRITFFVMEFVIGIYSKIITNP